MIARLRQVPHLLPQKSRSGAIGATCSISWRPRWGCPEELHRGARLIWQSPCPAGKTCTASARDWNLGACICRRLPMQPRNFPSRMSLNCRITATKINRIVGARRAAAGSEPSALHECRPGLRLLLPSCLLLHRLIAERCRSESQNTPTSLLQGAKRAVVFAVEQISKPSEVYKHGHSCQHILKKTMLADGSASACMPPGCPRRIESR